MRSESFRSRVISGFLWLAVTKAAAQGMAWLITLAVVRLLAPGDYGLMGMAVLVNGFLLLFNELGLGAAIIQDRELSDDHLSDLRWVILLLNCGLFVVLLVAAPIISEYFREPALLWIVRVMGAAFVMNGIGAPSAFVLSRQMAFRKKGQAELIGNTAGNLTTLGLALGGFSVWSLVAGYVVLQGVTNGVYYFYAPIPYRRPSFAGRVRASLRFGSQVALGKILWWISASADSVIVGRVLGTIQLGYYGLAVQLASLPLQKIVNLITQVALPSFAALQNDPATLRRYYLKLVEMTAFVTFPLFIGLFLVADIAVPLLLTDKWAPVVLPLEILCIVTCLRAVETLNTPVLVACNRPGIPLFNSFLQAIALPIGFLIGAQWGLKGVAAAWLVVWPVLYAIVTAQTLRILELPMRSYVSALRHPVSGVVCMALAVNIIRRSGSGDAASPFFLVVTCLSAALVYTAYHGAFNRDTLRELAETLRMRRNATRTPVTEQLPARESAQLPDYAGSPVAQLTERRSELERCVES